MSKYFYGVYSDGERADVYCDSLKAAVAHFAADVMGHTLVHVTGCDSDILWSMESGYYPKLAISKRAIDAANADLILKAIGKYKQYIYAGAVSDPKTGATAEFTGGSYTYENGVFTLKDAKGRPRKLIKLSVQEIELVNHKYGKDFLCENCKKHMADIEDMNGLCEV